MNTVAARAPAVAAAAPNSPGRYLQRKCSSCGSPSIGGATCRGCAAKAHARNPSAQAPAPQGGQALVPAVQADMSSRFGHDFSRVRVHTDAAAAASARSLGALAYTSGSDITFSAGRYDPASTDGRRLLAHELAHVVQQSGHVSGTQTQLAVSAPGDASERQADAAADAVLAGRAVPRLDALPARIARTCGPAALGAAVPDCAPSSAGVVGHHFLFDVNCDDLKSVEVTPGVFHTGAAAVADFVATVPAGSTINVHGFASGEGDAAFNMDLSCHQRQQGGHPAARRRVARGRHVQARWGDSATGPGLLARCKCGGGSSRSGSTECVRS